MNELLHTLGRGFALGIILCGLALPAFGTADNGDVVRISADCQYTCGAQAPWHALGTLDIALSSRLIDGPVYITKSPGQNWDMPAGLMVRAFVRKDGQTVLANGVQLKDGRVMVDGEILDRADPWASTNPTQTAPTSSDPVPSAIADDIDGK